MGLVKLLQSNLPSLGACSGRARTTWQVTGGEWPNVGHHAVNILDARGQSP